MARSAGAAFPRGGVVRFAVAMLAHETNTFRTIRPDRHGIIEAAAAPGVTLLPPR
jgi:hypothetical protein